jgi:hypothetical protein
VLESDADLVDVLEQGEVGVLVLVADPFLAGGGPLMCITLITQGHSLKQIARDLNLGRNPNPEGLQRLVCGVLQGGKIKGLAIESGE